jgi:hypothetical protein
MNVRHCCFPELRIADLNMNIIERTLPHALVLWSHFSDAYDALATCINRNRCQTPSLTSITRASTILLNIALYAASVPAANGPWIERGDVTAKATHHTTKQSPQRVHSGRYKALNTKLSRYPDPDLQRGASNPIVFRYVALFLCTSALADLHTRKPLPTHRTFKQRHLA